jgi:hypothetical protein
MNSDTLSNFLHCYCPNLGAEDIKNAKLPIEVMDFTRAQLAHFFYIMDFKKGVELGVADGKYSELLCKENPQCTVYSVDPWEIYGNNPVHYHYKDEAEVERFYKAACDKLLKLPNSLMIKKFGHQALDLFEDGELDFVYIDADHKLLSVVEDIVMWSAKVRKGGIIAGHDYIRHTKVMHVKEAIHAYTQAYDIRPWFTFGRLVSDERIKKDRERSWMFVKS